MTLPSYLSDQAIEEFIDQALAEDIGEGDHSTLAVIPSDLEHSARLLIKEDGIIAGIALAEKIFQRYDSGLKIAFFKHDGEAVKKGDVAFIVTGRVQSILSTERLVLNCMQRMSGIATFTQHLSGLIANTKARLMDTRKTTPNFRMMEKWAVSIGGALNHRFALYDMVMLKDNHIDESGGIQTAITKARAYLKKINKKLKIEVETRNLNEVEQVIKAGGVDVIMLDNMNIEEMKSAVALIGGRYKTEASGGINASNLKEVAECGVDYISIGALTHSVRSLDLSLKVIPSTGE